VRSKICLASVLWLVQPAAWAWGPQGHRVVGELAQRQLGPEATAELRRLLPGEGLAEVSNWSDFIRSNRAWDCGSPLHYTTVLPGTSWTGPPSEGDAVVAVVAFGDILADRTRSDSDRANALKWLVHIVGDLHQPLHVGRGCDRGANSVWVSWFGQQSNLHRVWDEEALDAEKLSYTDKVGFLDDATEDQLATWRAGAIFDWMDEAFALHPAVYQLDLKADCTCIPCAELRGEPDACAVEACGSFYSAPARLRYDYRSHALPLIDVQLRKGGARLGSLLDHLLSTGSWPDAWQDDVAAIRQVPGWSDAPSACIQPAEVP
jgi:hypothetical protein